MHVTGLLNCMSHQIITEILSAVGERLFQRNEESRLVMKNDVQEIQDQNVAHVGSYIPRAYSMHKMEAFSQSPT